MELAAGLLFMLLSPLPASLASDLTLTSDLDLSFSPPPLPLPLSLSSMNSLLLKEVEAGPEAAALALPEGNCIKIDSRKIDSRILFSRE